MNITNLVIFLVCLTFEYFNVVVLVEANKQLKGPTDLNKFLKFWGVCFTWIVGKAYQTVTAGF